MGRHLDVNIAKKIKIISNKTSHGLLQEEKEEEEMSGSAHECF